MSRTIALVGNPNSGKTSLFNVLTGLNQRVGNFPGVTVDRKVGKMKLDGETVNIVDLPGSYSLDPATQDESITTSILLDKNNRDYPDTVVVVVDATNVKRGLLMCTEVIDLGFPVVLAVNMVDLFDKGAEGKLLGKIKIGLGIPAVEISALHRRGIEDLKKELVECQASDSEIFQIPSAFDDAIDKVKVKYSLQNKYQAWRILLRPADVSFADASEVAAIRESAGIQKPEEFLGNEIAVRYDHINTLLEGVSPALVRQTKLTSKLDNFFLSKAGGYLFFIAIMALVFQAIFAWASYPMEWIESGFGMIGEGMRAALPAGFVGDLVVDGVWAGLGGIIVFVPQIALLFMFIAILEDTGYMSRVVFLMDRVMKPFGFSGKSVIPLIGGMACAVPSIMAARNIPSRKERLITILVTPLMSCSARIPVYTLLIGMFVPTTKLLGVFNLQGIAMMGLYMLGFVMALAVAFTMKKILRYDSKATFATEMPLYRAPRWRNVLLSMWNKSKTFIWEAGKVIMVVSVILWLLASFAPGDRFQQIDDKYAEIVQTENPDEEKLAELEITKNSEKLRASYAGEVGGFIEPMIKPLGFDWKIGIALVTSFAAREVFVGTMATIYSVGQEESDFNNLRSRMKAEKYPDTGKPVYSFAVALSLMVFYAFAMQCMSTLAVTRKETKSWKWTMVMLVYMTGLAWLASLFVFQVIGPFVS